MFAELIESLKLDADYPPRAQKIDAYMRVLNGEIYDKLPHPFSRERDFQGNYIPLSKRRPSVKYNMCKLVVDDSTSLLFGKDHFPKIKAEDNQVTDILQELAKGVNLRKIMLEASRTGSVGSVAVFVRVINQCYKIEVKGTQYLTAIFDPYDPTNLIKVIEKYKVKGRDLFAAGYDVDESGVDYWFMRVWDDEREIFYKPFRNGEQPKEDDKRTVIHGLGVVPVIWGKNLPKPSSRGFDEIDGACTFSQVIDINIETDYLLSQGGRGLKYSADPLVVFKVESDYQLSQNAVTVSDDIVGAKKIMRSASNALVLGTNDDAKLLEINGRASQAVIEHVRFLRELAMESLHGNRSNADKVSAAQSGNAMQQMNQPLIWLADALRIYYGEDVLIPLVRMMLTISTTNKVFLNGKLFMPIDPLMELTLKWPHWYPTTPQDKNNIANATRAHKDNGVLSARTITSYIAEDYGVTDVDDEMVEIAKDQEALAEQQPMIKEQINA